MTDDDHKQIKKILVPVDFSDDSRAALIWAIDEALARNAPLLILHVVHDPSHSPGKYTQDQAQDAPRPKEEVAEELLAQFIAEMHKSAANLARVAAIETRLVVGLPATRILEVAEGPEVLMIVMGSQGRRGLARLLTGSKAEQVVRCANVPVTVVKAKREI